MIKRPRGFTLVELSVVLFIVSLLLFGLLGPIATQIESKERQQTIDMMNDIKEALYGYTIINRALPCPDTTGDGAADVPCALTGDGWLPWQTLGLNFQGDVWGNRFKYHVTPGFTIADTGVCDAVDGELDLCEPGDITIRTRGNNTLTVATEAKFKYNAATAIPAAVVSHGKNGLGATTMNGIALTATKAGTDESENCEVTTTASCTDNIFYTRIFSEGATGCTDDTAEANQLCAFDDIVMWISPNILMNRMVKAGVLP